MDDTFARRIRARPWLVIAAIAAIAVGVLGAERMLDAADHRDSTALENDAAADIADVYYFQSPAQSGNVVFAMTVPGLISPAESSSTFFDPNVLYEFQIDTTGDAVEDRVIQVFATGTGSDQVLHVRGPAAPTMTGAQSRVLPGDDVASVRFSGPGDVRVGEGGGLKVFAGVRDDPFFFDLARFNEIAAGNATSFREPGVDTFAGTNALAIVVELPIAMLGGSQISAWGTTSRN
ncbi:MAG: DUF4331 family protein [Gemmatimonadota bacterium]|nr:DUF4331 family protein [Gemmatimonadota bacterium]